MQYRTGHAGEHVSAAPRRGARPHKAATSVPQGHFDPDELTRRLHMVLAEQKAQARRRQRAHGELSDRKPTGLGPFSSSRHRDGTRPGKEARQNPAEPPPAPATEQRTSAPAAGTHYHHVPSQAAAQFTLTTTAENMRNSSDLMHKLSKRALKVHLDGGAGPRTFDVDSKTALSPTAHLHHLERNSSQPHDPQQTQQPRSPRKHTFEDELARLLLPAGWHARRNSTGTTLDIAHTAAALGFSTSQDESSQNASYAAHQRRSMIALDPMLDALLEEGPPEEHARVDWTQSDEPVVVGAGAGRARTAGAGTTTGTATANGLGARPSSGGAGGPKLLMLSPLLRKADSLWALRAGRRGSKDSGSGGDGGGGVGVGVGGEGVPTVSSPKSPTGTGKTAAGTADDR